MIIGDMEIRLRADIARLQRDMDQARQVVNTTAGAVSRAADLMKGALAAIGIGAGISEIIRMSDQYTKFTAQLRLATQSQREYTAAYSDVKRIANSAQQDLGATGALYARVANGTRELGISQKQVADITETVNLSLKVSGATAAESASAQLQLSQAFASGTLRGEEFNAVNEAAPRLMKALADGLGVPIGALKEMASNGEITSKVMAEVLPKALQQVREESKHIETIGGAFTVLKNNVMEFTGVQAQANGTVAVLTTGLGLLANNLTLVAGAATTLGAVKIATMLEEWIAGTYRKVASAQAEVAALNASRAATIAAAEANLAGAVATGTQGVATQAAILIAREEMVARLAQARSNIAAAGAAIEAATAAGAQSFALRTLRLATTELAAAETTRAAMVAELALLGQQQARVSVQIAAATAAQTGAQTALNAANGVGVASIGLASRAMGLLGGPIGAVITVLGIAATAWSVWGSSSSKANEQASVTTEASTAEIVAQVQKQIDVLERRNALAAKGIPTTKRETSADNKLADVLAEADKVAKAEGDYANLSLAARTDILKVLGGQYGELTAVVERYNAAVAAGAGGTPEAKALVAVRERLTGVNQQYLKDLKTLQDARAVGAVGEKEYIALASQLATETWKSSDAGKAAVTSANKETEAYGTLITSIREAIETNKLELVTGENATASQKARAKLDQELASGKLKLSAGHLSVARAALDEQAATEQLLKTQQIEKDISKFREQGIEASLAATSALEIEAASYGKVADARDIANVALKINTELEKFLNDQRAAGKALTDDEIDTLRAEAKVRTQVEQATLAQSKAYGYAGQLATENKRFAAEYILDEKARAAALLAIDADTWQQRIALVAEGSDVRKKLEGEYATWYANQLAKPELEKHKQFWESIDRTAHDTFVSIMDGSKDAATRLRDTFKNIFFDWLYQMTIKKWIVSVGASLTGTGVAGVAEAAGGASGAGGASQIGGIVQAGKSLYDAIGTGFTGLASSISTGFVNLGSALGSSGLQAFGAGFGSTGMVGASDAAGLYAAAGGQGSASAVTAGAYSGAAVTAAAGIAAGVLGGNLISGQYGSKNTVYAGAAAGAAIGSIVPVIGTAIGALVGGIIGGIGNRLFGMGDKKYSTNGIRGTLSPDSFNGENFVDWTQKGGWFRSDKKGTDTSPIGSTQANAFTDTYKAILGVSALMAHTIGEGATRLSTRVQALNIDLTGLATDADRLAAVTKFFEGVGNSIATEIVPNLASFQKEGEALSTTLQRVAADYAGIDNVLATIGVTFGAVGASSIAARERLLAATGGLDALASGTLFFAQNFLSAAEQLAPAQKQVNEQLATLGYSQVHTADEYKKAVLDLVSSGQLASEGGAKTYAALLALAPAFKAVTDAAAEAQRDMLSQRADLQKELDGLTKTSLQLLSEQRDALDASNRSLFDQVQAVKAAKAAQDAAKTALQGVIDKTATFAASMTKLRSDLLGGDMSILNPMDKYKQARLEYDKDLALARGGDADAQDKLAGLATAFLNASKAVNATGSDYTSDFIKIQQDAEEAAKWASQQVDLGQATLDAYNKSIGVLEGISSGVASVDAAIRALVDAGGFVKPNGSHASGLARVPYDGYIAQVHDGEGIIDAPAMSAMRRYFGGAPSTGGGEASRAELVALRTEVAGLRADLAKHTGAMIQATYDSNNKNAEKINSGAKRSATESAWQRQSKPGVPA